MNSLIAKDLSVKKEAAIFLILTVSALLLRINNLSADPPIGLSFSQGIYTDPAQYISYARNLVHWGSFNPLHDFRLVFFLKSVTTVVSYLIFSLFGVGYMQSNFVGLVFSFPSLILFYFIVRKAAGNLAALFYLIFIFLDYNQLFFGRLSFLENGMIFFAFLSTTILLYGRRIYALFLSGLFLAAGIFFGKIIGLIFLFPFTCYGLYQYFYEYRDNKAGFLRCYLPFICGFFGILIFWYFFSYRPATASVSGYVQEQALALYGTPEALLSLDKFIYNLVSFGAKSKLFIRMPIPGLLCWGIMAIFFFRICQKEGWKDRLGGVSGGIIFMIALLIAAYGSLMIWNYRPPRYQTVLIYPICGLAGVFVNHIFFGDKTSIKRRWYLLAGLIIFIFVTIPYYQLLGPVFKYLERPFYYIELRLLIFGIPLLLALLYILLLKYFRISTLKPPLWFKQGIIVIAVLATVLPHARLYWKWSEARTYNTINIARDLAQILSPEAVVSGPYAADLTQDNRIRNLIHMFGVAKVDSIFFKKYPITHLLIDKPNAKAAAKQYPNIMKYADLIGQYYMPTRPIHLYRIAGATGNILADNYILSKYELCRHHFRNNNFDSAYYYLNNFLANQPDNHAANFFAAEIAREKGKLEVAIDYIGKAINFSPTDFYLRLRLGEYYIRVYKKTKDSDYLNKAKAEFKTATKFNPDSRRLKREIDNLLKGKERGEFE